MKQTKTRRQQRSQPAIQMARPAMLGGPLGSFREFEMPVDPVAPSHWPSISVCMIVKDESSNLRECFKSLGDLASEIIVLDTGSTDDTVRIAQELGAKVHHFAWTNDFAEARNESIRHAAGEWIFWLDGDDRLSPRSVAQLKRAAASQRADAYICLVSSVEADGKRNTVEHIRLFRNGLGIRFFGGIHETVGPDLIRLGLRLADTDIEIQHTGYESAEAVRKKSARNLPVIEREIALHPEKVDLLFYRGHSFVNLERFDEAIADMRAYLSRTAPQKSFAYQRFLAYSVYISVLDLRGDRDALEPLLRQALAEFPGHPHFQLLLARLTLRQGQPREALRLLRDTYAALDKPVRGPRPREAWVELATAEVHQAMGEKGLALEWGEKARKHAPDWEMGGNFLARLYLENGRTVEAEELLSELFETARTPEPWLLMAGIHSRQGRFDRAAEAIREAQSRGLPEDQANQRLAQLRAAALATTKTNVNSSPEQVREQLRGLDLLGKRDFLQAAQCFAEAIQAAPNDPDNYRYLAATLRELGREEEALEAWQLANYWATQAQKVGVRS